MVSSKRPTPVAPPSARVTTSPARPRCESSSVKALARSRRTGLSSLASVSRHRRSLPAAAKASTKPATSSRLLDVTRSTPPSATSRSSSTTGRRPAAAAIASSLPPQVLTTRPSTLASISLVSDSASLAESLPLMAVMSEQPRAAALAESPSSIALENGLAMSARITPMRLVRELRRLRAAARGR